MSRACPSQRGTSLIEALLAFLVLSLGMLGAVRLQRHVEHGADLARQRSEAVRLAQQDIEQLRGFTAVAAASGVRSYAAIAPAEVEIGPSAADQGSASYRVERRIAEPSVGLLKTASVNVHWTDRTGQPHRVLLQSAISGTPPALSAVLPVHAGAPPTRSVQGRSPRIPADSRDLGDGRSLFRPTAASTLAFVLSNTTGQVIARCTAGAGEFVDAAGCVAVEGLLLSGWIRFSLAAAPDAAGADALLPLAMSLELTPGSAAPEPECFVHPRAGLVAYHCVVATSIPWSGRSRVVPLGWALGTAPGELRVCRYVGDHDGSGAIDRNAEHPEHYSQVDVNLMQQNFLVIHGDRPCPASPAAITVAHQP